MTNDDELSTDAILGGVVLTLLGLVFALCVVIPLMIL